MAEQQTEEHSNSEPMNIEQGISNFEVELLKSSVRYWRLDIRIL
jgi:hypothetical protein